MSENPSHNPEVQHQWVKDQLNDLQAEIADGLNKDEVTQILTDKQNDPFSENSAQTALAAQVALKILKFNPGKLDGIIGGGTKGATRAFQESWNTDNPEDTIAVDGELGPITISKLITKLGGTAPALAEKAKSTAEQIDYSPLNSLYKGVEGLKVENVKWGGEEKYIAQSVSKNGQHLFEVYYSNEEDSKGWYYMRFTSADQTFGIPIENSEEMASNWLSKEQVQAAIQKTQDVESNSNDIQIPKKIAEKIDKLIEKDAIDWDEEEPFYEMNGGLYVNTYYRHNPLTDIRIGTTEEAQAATLNQVYKAQRQEKLQKEKQERVQSFEENPPIQMSIITEKLAKINEEADIEWDADETFYLDGNDVYVEMINMKDFIHTSDKKIHSFPDSTNEEEKKKLIQYLNDKKDDFKALNPENSPEEQKIKEAEAKKTPEPEVKPTEKEQKEEAPKLKDKDDTSFPKIREAFFKAIDGSHVDWQNFLGDDVNPDLFYLEDGKLKVDLLSVQLNKTAQVYRQWELNPFGNDAVMLDLNEYNPDTQEEILYKVKRMTTSLRVAKQIRAQKENTPVPEGHPDPEQLVTLFRDSNYGPYVGKIQYLQLPGIKRTSIQYRKGDKMIGTIMIDSDGKFQTSNVSEKKVQDVVNGDEMDVKVWLERMA